MHTSKNFFFFFKAETADFPNSRHIRQPQAELNVRLLFLLLYYLFFLFRIFYIAFFPLDFSFSFCPCYLSVSFSICSRPATGLIFSILYSSIDILYMLGCIPAQMFLLGCTGVSELYPTVYFAYRVKPGMPQVLFMEAFKIGLHLFFYFFFLLKNCGKRLPNHNTQ